jgi:hypothetical protein
VTSPLEDALRALAAAAVEARSEVAPSVVQEWPRPIIENKSRENRSVSTPPAEFAADYRWLALRVVEHLEADQRLADACEAISREVGKRPLDARKLIEGLLWLYFERADLAHDDAQLGAVVADLAWLLNEPTRTVLMRGVLTNYEGGEQPITLADDVRIVALDDSMIETIWRRHGNALWQMNPMSAALDASFWTHAIEVECRFPVEDGFNAGPFQRRLSDAEAALAIHSPEAVAIAATWMPTEPSWADHFASALPGQGFGMGGLGGAAYMGPLRGDPYTVSAGDEAALAETFARYVEAKGDQPFELAVRNYVRAVKEVRRRVEDRILDYWIAFEALFVPEEGSELSYRASLRIARVVGTTPAERAELLAFLRHASYKARSYVAHGGDPAEPIKVKAAPPVTLDEVTTRTRAILSGALRAWIDPDTPTDADAIDAKLLE